MRDLKRRGFQMLVLLAAGAISVGCSSSNQTSGTGGSTGSGGGGGAGGGGRMCGAPADAGAGLCQVAPCDGVIANFSSADGGIPIMGGLTNWGGAFNRPTYSVDSGTLTLMETSSQGATPQYVGVTLYFFSCVDASAYSGVEFTVSGSVSSMCRLVFGANDVAHDDHASDSKGTCDAGSNCYAPNMVVPGTISSTPTTVKVPWIMGGSVPDVPLDPGQLTGIQWQFTIDPAPDGGTPEDCNAQLAISDVKFYK
ncbi:MAG TPA: hypothetical protein VMT03_07620 [Polyangia bacterium]|nr:hypothetical protein [Polyangia bacterium]